ncbi:DEAD/DEAH box helicase family protein, partial [Patescibacteria group bacterium]|nr:DEAD/DEAH box helicase family protein [Patescibacteria group bacterium]
MTNFIINNKDITLKMRLEELITKSVELKFLVGFFYFSGLDELYKSLQNNKDVIIKILVGLNVDEINHQLIEYADVGSNSNENIFNNYISSIKKSINTDNFDEKDFYDQVSFFNDLIKQDRLIIRKTYYPNHAKLYIFKLNQDQIARDRLFITGSSNLTRPGLSEQEEFNVEISDFGVDAAEEYFDELWNKSIKITEIPAKKNKLIEIIEKDTLVRKITPFEAYAYVIKTYLDVFEKKNVDDTLKKIFKDNGYTPYEYQLDAIKQALAIIEKNNGVILADVVGLGKTIIACSIAYELHKRGVIICPPGLKGNSKYKDAGWNMYKEQFKLHDWEVWSLGELDKLQEQMSNDKLKDIEVVIVDEAHRFRNQDTQSYEYLKNICRGKIVILLSATPFNNSPADILSLLSLFITPKNSSISLDDNLAAKFRQFKYVFDMLGYINKNYNSPDEDKKNKALTKYNEIFNTDDSEINMNLVKQRSKSLAKQIRDIIEPVIIRRNRLDLINNTFYQNELKSLSVVKDPQEWFYKLSKDQSNFYENVIKYFSDFEGERRFTGAIYKPAHYEKDYDKVSEKNRQENFEFNSQANLYNFIRRLLVRRFESSFGSFKQSLENLKKTNEYVLEFVKKTNKYILDRDFIEKIHILEPEEIENELIKRIEALNTENNNKKNSKIYYLDDFVKKDEFLSDIQSDISLFDDILNELKKLKLIDEDPKSKTLIENIKKQLHDEPNRKIVIFTEYIDTVKHLSERLNSAFNGRVLSIAGDMKSKIEDINKNFDATYKKQEDRYDILLCTDKLSEGFNLNRAGMVINYDIPWNPVRVIQRIGRINRISKKVFDELYIVNFFPTEIGANEMKSREIASAKMFLIHNILGEDAKIFDIDEVPSPSDLYDKLKQNPDDLEKESFYTKILKEYEQIKNSYPDMITSLDNLPRRIKVAKKGNENELLLFIKKFGLYISYANYSSNDKKTEISMEDAFEKIKCDAYDKSIDLSGNFWDYYKELKDIYDKKTISTNKRENDPERKALNTINSLINSKNYRFQQYHIDFLKMLKEDIIDYGTLPTKTLRRIAAMNCKSENNIQKTINEIESLIREMGSNYLEIEKKR